MKTWIKILIGISIAVAIYFLFFRAKSSTGAQNAILIAQLKAERDALSLQISNLQTKIDNNFPGDPNDSINLGLLKSRVNEIDQQLITLQK